MSKFMQTVQNFKPLEDVNVTIEDEGGIFGESGVSDDSLIMLDGDTLAGTDGSKYRVAGLAAPEVAQVSQGRRTIDIKEGEAGGPEMASAINQLIQSGGFNRVVKTGGTSHDREEVVLMNDKGENLTEVAYRSGLLKPDANTTPEMVAVYEQGLAAREMGIDTGYEQIVNEFDSAMLQNRLPYFSASGVPGFGVEAPDEFTYAGAPHADAHNIYTGVQERDPDRTMDNMARNSIGASAYTGWVGMKEGAFGALEMLGDSMGIDWVEDMGNAGLTRSEQNKMKMAGIDNIAWDDVGSVGDFFQYLGNNAAMSAPYLGLTAAGGLLAPLTGGSSLGVAAGAVLAATPSSMVYAGQIWNDMEGEKNAGAALAGGYAAGLVDRLGLQGILRPSSILTANGKQAVAQALYQSGKAASLEAAQAMAEKAGKEVAYETLKHMSVASAGQAASLIARDGVIKETVRGLGKAALGGVSEGLTEAAQEAIQYGVSVGYSNREYNQFELEDRIRDALIAGATLGAGLGGAGGVLEYGSRDAMIRDLQKANLKHLNDVEQLRETLRRDGVVLESTNEIREKVRNEVAEWEPTQQALAETDVKGKKKKSRLGSFSRRAFQHQKDNKGFYNALKDIQSIPDGIAKAVTGVGKLVSAAATTAFNPTDMANPEYGQTLRDIRALVGQTRGVINSGRSFEGHQDHLYSEMAQMVYLPEVMSRFGRAQEGTTSARNDISAMLREYAKQGFYDRAKKGEDVTADLPVEMQPYAAALKKSAEDLENMANHMWAVQNQASLNDGGEGVGKVEGWWWKHRDFDPQKVQKNREAWYEFMQTHTNMSKAELDQFYDRITSGDASTETDFFSHVRGIEFVPGQHMQRDAKLSEKEGFDAFGRDDIFATLDSSARSASRYATNRDFFGAGGKNLDYLFDKLEKEGMPQDKINEVAWYTKSIIDSATGNFNRIQNPRWASVQKFASTWAVFAGLPLSTLSSIPESAMVALGMDKKEFAGAISTAGEQIAKTFAEAADQGFKDAINNGEVIPVDEAGNQVKVPREQQLLNRAGLLWHPGSIAKRIGVGETNINYQWLQDKFFRGIGLTYLTQAQRRAAASSAVDFVSNRLSELSTAPNMMQLTNRQQHVYNQLAELGMDVDQMVELWKDFGNNDQLLDYTGEKRNVPEDIMKIVDNQMETAIYNFTNLRVQNPGAANRPLFFQDPHYQMFTQFNGFISTFTANVVPKLWNDYLKRGTPQVKYNTFALMVTMMALGAGSQYMKDWLKYGRVTPYLSAPQQLQRAIYSSGVLGQAERVVDIVLPLYGARPRSDIDSLLDIFIGETGPTVRNVGQVLTAGGQLASGEAEQAAKTVSRVTPFIAPFGGVRGGLVDVLFGGGNIRAGFDYYDEL